MKKIVLALGLASSLYSSAQLEKNTVFVGGFVLPKFAHFSQPFNFNNVYSRVTPNAGIMLSQKWALGAEFNYQAYGPKSNRYYESFYAGAFARYYFINKKYFSLYENFGIGYKHADYNMISINDKFNFIPTKIGAGTSWFVGKNISLDAEVNVVFTGPKLHSYMDTKIGLHYYIRPKKK